MSDLTELAGALALAGDHGAAVLDTVSTKARSLRERLVAEAERRAVAVTERMGIPATLVLIGFTAFLLFPALAAFRPPPDTQETSMLTFIQKLVVLILASQRDPALRDRGEIVEKAIIVVAAAILAGAAMAVITTQVNIKIAGLSL